MVSFTAVLSASALLLASQVFAQIPSFNPSQIPSSCKDTCLSVTNNLQSCTSSSSATSTSDPKALLSCICTDANAQNLATCFACAVSIKASGLDQQTAQTSVNSYIEGCSAGGISLKPATVSSGGSTGNGALSAGLVNVGAVAAAGMGTIYALL